MEVGKSPHRGHSPPYTRVTAALAVFDQIASLEAICKVAIWATPNTFIEHYKIHQAASAEAAFGHRVLRRVVPQWGVL